AYRTRTATISSVVSLYRHNTARRGRSFSTVAIGSQILRLPAVSNFVTVSPRAQRARFYVPSCEGVSTGLESQPSRSPGPPPALRAGRPPERRFIRGSGATEIAHVWHRWYLSHRSR